MAFVSPEPNSGCWLWTGSMDNKGYGQLRCERLRYATHVSLELAGRPLPAGMQACHHCDMPACVNPDHLFAGTARDNMQDCVRKGRNSPPPICTKGSRPLRTHCCHGHPLSGANLWTASDGARHCVSCRNDRKRTKRATFISLGLTARGTARSDHWIMSQELVDRVSEMTRAGVPYSEIGRQIGISRELAYYHGRKVAP